MVRSFQRACYLVLALSALASGVLLIPVVQRYAEMSLLVLVMLNLLANWCVISHFQGELRQIKEKNQWTYSRKKIMTVDLSVTREKGRSGVSPFWVWLFLPLSFAPMAVLLLHPALRQRCPLGMIKEKLEMELKDILGKCDHTILAQTATWEEVRAVCDDGLNYGCASVCIPASYVAQAAEHLGGRLPVCTVIGFPNGYDTTASKCFMVYPEH